MPTLSGLRRRGHPPAATRAFAERIDVARRESTIEVALLEHAAPELLNQSVEHRNTVLRPLKVVLESLSCPGATTRRRAAAKGRTGGG